MPMMRGIKFACEPCIRGHRSSKCNHSDRVLVQVRKPGRPLSSCPHTLSSSSPGTFVHSLPAGSSGGGGGEDGGMNCSCDVTSVAIPKIASCACGTSKPHEPPSRPLSLSIAPLSPGTNGSSSMMITSPISPTSPTIISSSSLTNGSANRVNKPQRPKRKGTGDGTSRRGSVIGGEAALELLLEKEKEMNESAEVVKVEELGNCCRGTTNISNRSGTVNGNGVQGFVPVFSTTIQNGHGNGFHLQQQQQPSNLQDESVTTGGSKPVTVLDSGLGPKLDMGVNDVLSLDTWNPDEVGSPSWQPTPKKTRGCCGSKSSQSSQQPQYMHHTPSQPNLQSRPCCSGGSNGSTKSPLPIPQQQPVPIPIPYTTPRLFPAPQYPPQYFQTPNFPQMPPMWMYPTGFSTINHPLTPQELAWLQHQRAAGVFDHVPSVQPPPSHSVISPMVSSADGWAHSCICGPNCDCLGCATHPYNRRTMEYVQGIQQFMEGDNVYSNSHSHSRALSQQLPQTPQQTGFGSNGQISSPPPHSHTSVPPADVLSSNGNGTPTSAPCCGKGESHSHNNRSNQNQQLSPPPEHDDETEAGGTPGGTPGDTDNGEELSPSNFIHVDYPLGTCAQTETGCKCGEGCTCVGCLTHGGHDGVELTANVDGSEDWW